MSSRRRSASCGMRTSSSLLSGWCRVAVGTELTAYTPRPTARKAGSDVAGGRVGSVIPLHGVNVLLAALNDPHTRQAVRALVCLSTPFISVRDHWTGKRNKLRGLWRTLAVR